MSDQKLRADVIRLASAKPELRWHVPITRGDRRGVGSPVLTEVQVTPPMRSGDMSPEQIIASLSALDRQELLRLLTLPRVDFPLRSYTPAPRLTATA